MEPGKLIVACTQATTMASHAEALSIGAKLGE